MTATGMAIAGYIFIAIVIIGALWVSGDNAALQSEDQAISDRLAAIWDCVKMGQHLTVVGDPQCHACFLNIHLEDTHAAEPQRDHRRLHSDRD